jgi:membrane protease YdiL (CAAX protease family)
LSESSASCLKCSNKLRPSSQFCAGCGLRVGEQPETALAPTGPHDESEVDERWPALRGALSLFGAALATYFVTMLIDSFVDSPWTDVGGSLAFSLIVLGFMLADLDHVMPLLKSVPARLPLRKTTLLLVGSVLLLRGYFALLQGMGVPFLRYSEQILDAHWPVWSLYVLVVAQPAIFEEIAFRGIVLGRLQRALGAKEAFLVQGAMFSVLHLSPLIFPSHFVMGLVFGWLRLRSGTLLPGMLAHAAWNSWVVWTELHGAR